VEFSLVELLSRRTFDIPAVGGRPAMIPWVSMRSRLTSPVDG
jgi:hypothetical protein